MSDDVYRAKYNRTITWDKDTMKIADSVSDIWRDTVNEMCDNMNKQTEMEVLRHFELDMSELREFMRYKEVGVSIPRWIPVSERTPEGRPYVLCCGAKGGMFVGWVCDYHERDNGKAMAILPDGHGRRITHWMPLPMPPKEVSDG